MPRLTEAEKSKRYREKLKATDPEKYKETVRAGAERGRQSYKRKLSALDAEQKKTLPKKRRENKATPNSDKIHQNDSSQNNDCNNETCKTKCENDRIIQRRVERSLRHDNDKLKKSVVLLKRGYNNLLRKINNYHSKLDVMNKKIDVLSKMVKVGSSAETTSSAMTPNKLSKHFVDEILPDVDASRKEAVKKIVFEHHVLSEALKGKYYESGNEEKKTFKGIANTDLVKKYKMKKKITQKLGLKQIRNYQSNKKISEQLQRKLTMFFEQDDVSRASSGKRECKTLKGCTKQKRYLLDSLLNLHKKYIAQNGYIGLSTFKKYRPFYVVAPKLKDLDTCACAQHSNMQFMANKLKLCGVLDTNDLNEVVSKFVCDKTFKDCMYGICSVCNESFVEEKEEFNKDTSWTAFNLKEHTYTDKGETKKTKRMVKEEKKGTVNELIKLFNTKLKTFKTHVFNVRHQYQQYKLCTTNMKKHEIAIHVDFSENWTCKLNQEVQAMHFGSSKNQITLHTGVLYYKDCTKPISFCSISPDNSHSPEAIWAHLDPVIDFIKKNFPDISTLHIFSDGPTSQYRQKKNFYLFSHHIPDYGFSTATWSFFEAAHGKGAADGIGGAIKRTLDFQVTHGTDIPDAQTAFDVLSKTDTVVKLFYIPAEKIKVMDSEIVKKLTPLHQTMKVHQVILKDKHLLSHRVLSCFCENQEGKCNCYEPKIHKFNVGISNAEENQETEFILELDENTGNIRKVAKNKENDANNINEDEDLVDFINMEELNEDTMNESLVVLVEDDENTGNIRKVAKNKENDENNINEDEDLVDFINMEELNEDTLNESLVVLVEDELQKTMQISTSCERKSEKRKKREQDQESSDENDANISLHDTSSEGEFLEEECFKEDDDISKNRYDVEQAKENNQRDKTRDQDTQDKQNQQEKTEEKYTQEVNTEKEITIDTYLLVKFNLEKRSKFYLGQVLEITGKCSYKIKFLRHKGNGKFAWPATDDVSIIYRSDIEKIWSNPLSDRRGIKTFDISKLRNKIE